jgi:hypothetical protein
MHVSAADPPALAVTGARAQAALRARLHQPPPELVHVAGAQGEREVAASQLAPQESLRLVEPR